MAKRALNSPLPPATQTRPRPHLPQQHHQPSSPSDEISPAPLGVSPPTFPPPVHTSPTSPTSPSSSNWGPPPTSPPTIPLPPPPFFPTDPGLDRVARTVARVAHHERHEPDPARVAVLHRVADGLATGLEAVRRAERAARQAVAEARRAEVAAVAAGRAAAAR